MARASPAESYMLFQGATRVDVRAWNAYELKTGSVGAEVTLSAAAGGTLEVLFTLGLEASAGLGTSTPVYRITRDGALLVTSVPARVELR